MPSELPRMPIYLNETMKLKFEYIAFKHGRTNNGEVRHLLSRYIDQYENGYGEIRFDYFCERLSRPIVLEKGNCYLKVKCKFNDCRQRGGNMDYVRKR